MFILFMTWTFVDVVNGVALKELELDIGVSQFYKALMILLCVCFLTFQRLVIVFAMAVVAVVMLCVQYFGGYGVKESAVWVGRAFGIVVFFMYFKSEHSRSADEVLKFIFVFCIISLLVAYANVLLGWFGYGRSQYGDGVGGTGYIYAGNELTLLILCCQLVILSILFFGGSNKAVWLLYAVFLAFSVLKSTKTSMLMMFIIGAVFALLSVFRARELKRLLVLSPVVLMSLLGGWYLAVNYGLFDRFSYFYERLDFWTFIFSGRNILAADALDYIGRNHGLLEWFFGVGVDRLKEVVGGQVEIDPIDVFLSFGVMGVVVFYGFFFLRFLLVFRNLLGVRRSRIDVLELSTLISLLFVSVFAGHVVNSGIAAVFIAVVFVCFDLLKVQEHESRSRF